MLIGAYDVISRIFGQGAVIDAYYRTDPDTMDFRAEDDDFLKHVNSSATMTVKRIERASEHPGTIRESPVDNAQEIKSSWAFSTNIFCTFVALC